MNFNLLRSIAEGEGNLMELGPDDPMQKGDYVAWMCDCQLTDLQTIASSSPMIGNSRRVEFHLVSAYDLVNKHRVFRVAKRCLKCEGSGIEEDHG